MAARSFLQRGECVQDLSPVDRSATQASGAVARDHWVRRA
jgi:hypothetical protein